jgi:mono/diheme cytochrome c family protein
LKIRRGRKWADTVTCVRALPSGPVLGGSVPAAGARRPDDKARGARNSRIYDEQRRQPGCPQQAVVILRGLAIRLRASVAVGVLFLLLLIQQAVVTQSARSAWDGVFTLEQAVRGETTYQKECASCHGASLEGETFAPPLIGDAFSLRWRDGTVGDFLLVVKATMPADRPGVLTADEYADVAAYVFKMNGFPDGEQTLSGDADRSRDIRFAKEPTSPR